MGLVNAPVNAAVLWSPPQLTTSPPPPPPYSHSLYSTKQEIDFRVSQAGSQVDKTDRSPLSTAADDGGWGYKVSQTQTSITAVAAAAMHACNSS